jgi:hypothetical protein
MYFKPLKVCNLSELYLRIQFSPHCQRILCHDQNQLNNKSVQKICVGCCEHRMKNVNKVCGQNTGF